MNKTPEHLAAKELRRLRQNMRFFPVIIIGAWGLAGLYTCLVWGIFDVSAKIGEAVGEPEALPIAWDMTILISNILVVLVA